MRRVIIAGGRDFDDNDFLMEVMADLYEGVFDPKIEVVSGGATGADTLGAEWAAIWSLPVRTFPADWEAYGKAAGPVRNQQMAEYADVLVAFWDGKSRGTRSMIQIALNEGLEVHVYRYDDG